MFKPAGSWSGFLCALIIAAFLAAGCSPGSPEHSQPTAQNDSGAALATAAPEAGSGGAPSSLPSAETEGGKSISGEPSAEAPGTAEGSSIQTPQQPGSGSVQATPEASTAAGDHPAAASSEDGPVKVPVTTQKAAAPAVKPSATVKPAGPSPAPAADSKDRVSTATLSVSGGTEYGMILSPAGVEVKSGDSVMDLLKIITRKSRIQMEFQGAGAMAYVKGIDNLYEHDEGPESGWMYRVNGEFPDEGAGAYKVAPGDVIEWLYTLDLGKDIGAKVP